VRKNTCRVVWQLTVLLVLVSLLGLPAAAAAGPAPAQAAAPSQPNIVVDGLVDDAYGPPIASDLVGDGNGNANMDLQDLYVAEDTSYIYVAFTIHANINTTNWGKYVLYVDTTNDANGATSDAWTRNVAVNDPHKPEYGLYSWVDCGTYDPSCTQVWAWNGSGWDGSGALDGAAKATTGITSTLEWQIQKSRLGNPEEIWVEVWDTGGGSNDNAQDTINDPADDWNATDWSTTAVLDNSTYYDVQGGVPPQPGHDNNVWWDGLEHDSRSDFYRIPFGAVPTSTPFTLRFRTYANDVTSVKVRAWDTALAGQILYPMSYLTTIPGDPYDYDIWQLQLSAPDYLTVLYYRFVVTDGTDTDYYEDDDLFDGGLGQAYDTSPDYSWQIDVYDPGLTTPDWFKNAVVYQIFPERFRNGVSANDPISGTFFYDEDPGVLVAPQWNWIVPDPRVTGSPWEGSYSKLFYGGDLQGIVDELDYLQSLGINTLYLNPIFESPSNHKYDTTNYEVVDDNFGDLATFQALVAALDARGMHLILDGVFNHTSSDSHYFDRYGRYPSFVGACEDVNSPYRQWYYFSPASPPGTGVCAGDTNYNAWWGFDSLPKLNTTDNDQVRDYLYRTVPPVATYWLDQGADGWRLDVAGDVDASFWRDWRPYIRAADPDAITIAEEWGDASRFVLGDELDSAMNYRFRNAIIGLLRETDWQDTNSSIRALSVSQFDSLIHSFEEDYPSQVFYALMNLVGSHDTNRVLIPLDQDGDPTNADYSDGKARLRVLSIIQMTLPGAPTVYYGDEVGLVGYGDPDGGGVFYSDPYNRQPYPWPDEPGYGSLPAWRQQDTALLAHYSTLAAIRNAHPALRTGSFDTLLADNTNDLYAYGRKLGNDAAVVVVNRSTSARGVAQAVTVDVSGYLPDGTALTDDLNGGAYTVSGGQIVLADLPSLSGAVLTVDSGQDLTPPDAPANLAATEGNGEVQLSWDAVADAAGYSVYRSYVSGGGYTRIATGTVTTTYTDTAVTNGTWYYYVVTALDAPGNESERSYEAAALPHAPIGWAGNLEPPAIVHTIGLAPTPPISGQVWIDGVTNPPGQGAGVLAELGYGISGTLTATWDVWVPMQYAADVGNNDQYTATLTPEMTGTFQYLARFSTTAGRDWTYAYTSGGQPGVLTVQPSSDTTPPATPQNLRVTDWSAGWIALAWDPVSGDPTLYAYDVFRQEVGREAWTKVGRVLAPDTAYTDADVATGHTYAYVVQAVDSSFNHSGDSNQVEATAQAKLVAVTFQAVVPDYTPADATVYVVGDVPELCGWCNPQTIAMEKTGDVTWTKTITLPDGQAIQYKYTRGNWDINEWWGPIVSVFNRHATVEYGSDGTQLLADVVHYWRDPLVISHQPADGATGVDPAVVISATLSRYLDPATITADNLVLSDGSTPTALDIGFFYHTEMTATTILMTPTAALAWGTAYTVTLGTGLTGLNSDNEGISLQRPYDWSFRTVDEELARIYLPIIAKNAGGTKR
jgi:glycosidase